MTTPPKSRRIVDDLRGASRLAVEATKAVTDVVEAMHDTIASGPRILGRPLRAPVRMINGIVYGSIRGVTSLVGSGLDAALAQLAPLLGEREPRAETDAVLAALNGVLGDYLHETENPLAIVMAIRRGGRALPIERGALRAEVPDATGKIVLLVHGSSMCDRQWSRSGHDHGAALERDLGCTSVYLHYNTGLHISTNGRALAALLDRLVTEWPVPVESIAIVGHSMGGLVARSACHHAELEGRTWLAKLRALVCLGSPHHGAPLERGGNLFELLLGISRYSAPLAKLGKIRSCGVTDMRFGSVLDEDWQGRDRFAYGADDRMHLALPRGVECYAIAASTAASSSDRVSGDGLVTVDSALGRHQKPDLTLRFADEWIGFGMGHLDLLNRPEVYDVLRRWLEALSGATA